MVTDPKHIFLHNGVAGVRPAGSFWRRVTVAPQPGELRRISAETPTPKGRVVTQLEFEGKRVRGTITLPPSLPGTFVWGEQRRELAVGRNVFDVSSGAH